MTPHETPDTGPLDIARPGPLEPPDTHKPDTHKPDTHKPETYNHWTIVNLVFHHLAAQGLHPVLGGPNSPGAAAAELLRALGVEPLPEGNRKVTEQVQARLAELRAAVFEE
jgi:hypothetical protein